MNPDVWILEEIISIGNSSKYQFKGVFESLETAEIELIENHINIRRSGSHANTQFFTDHKGRQWLAYPVEFGKFIIYP